MGVKAIQKFTVRTVLPDNLSALPELAANLRWSWDAPTRELFAHIAPELWEASKNPSTLLGEVSTARINELAADQGFVDWAERLRFDLRDYLEQPRWYQQLPAGAPECIAYFSPEFGVAAALPQYSGGLGILAGDHLKSASDLGLPLVGVGLFYHAGYFSQSISADGWQQETYPVFNPEGLPLSLLRTIEGVPAIVSLALPDGDTLRARIWQAAVGRVTLLMLDTDVPENDPHLRQVTDRLYGGVGEHRLLQELLLGIGGVRALRVWSELTGAPAPQVFHTNEGHAGFLGLERISELIGGGLSFDEALQMVRAGTVFTTHTPVPAGIDRFEASLVKRYLESDLLPGVDTGQVLALGDEDSGDAPGNVFNMAVMGLRLGQHANGVSQLHGNVSRGMFSSLWPGFDIDEVPISSVTNGVHAPSWTDAVLKNLAREKFGTDDTTAVDWASDAVSDEELWNARREMRQATVTDARRRVVAAWQRAHTSGTAPTWMNSILDPDVLTIGFARRVPTYKRLTLMLHDRDRLRSILLHPERPVQIIIAGKSHPADDAGKHMIQEIVQFASAPELRGRMVFLPDYDIDMASRMYPGTDVWLNNPLRPLEACGTSGMKVALNGGLNLSILDGWWDEFFDGENGWAIPSASDSHDPNERDAMEANAMYDLLENQITHRFYDQDERGIPLGWVRSMRHTLSTLSAPLSADRMVKEYTERFYLVASRAEEKLASDQYQGARQLSAWKQRVRDAWGGVSVVNVESGGLDTVPQVGDSLQVRALVDLGNLTPEDVSVEVVYGSSSGDDLTNVVIQELEPTEAALAGGSTDYAGSVRLERSGAFGFTVRIVPKHPLLGSRAELGLVALA